MRIRFRTDNARLADDAARIARGEATISSDLDEIGDTPPAVPGDVWRVHWYKQGDPVGPFAGYDICCPKCLKVHGWTTARNCASRVDGRCQHSGNSSCWSWTGSAEDGTLSASPSLHCDPALGWCGFHGCLTNGELTG